jgi:hypothetical protein
MKRIRFSVVLSCLLILTFYSAHSQYPVHGSDVLLDKLRLNKSISGIDNVLYSDIAGDPYIFKGFYQGELFLKSGETYRVHLRYDIYGNQIHMREKEQIYGIIHPEKISKIIIDTLQLIYSDYINSRGHKSSGNGSYFILKTDGKCRLLIKKNIRIQDAEPPKLYQAAKPAKFIPTGDTYYLKQGEKSAIRINSKRDIMNALADKKDEIIRFINSQRPGLKNQGDLERLVSYYNGL